jgi:hypothetical protein
MHLIDCNFFIATNQRFTNGGPRANQIFFWSALTIKNRFFQNFCSEIVLNLDFSSDILFENIKLE